MISAVHPLTHRALVTADGRIDRSAVMLLAHQRTRREASLQARVGGEVPSYRLLFAIEMRQAWEWARSVQRGREWATLYEPHREVATPAPTLQAA